MIARRQPAPVYFPEAGDIATLECVYGYGPTAHVYNDRNAWACSHCGGETRPTKQPEVKRPRDEDAKPWTPPAAPISATVHLRDGTNYEFPLGSGDHDLGFQLLVKPFGEAGGFSHAAHELDRVEFNYGRGD